MGDFTEEQLAKITAAIDQSFYSNDVEKIKRKLLNELNRPPNPVFEKGQLYLFRARPNEDWRVFCWDGSRLDNIERRLPNLTELGPHVCALRNSVKHEILTAPGPKQALKLALDAFDKAHPKS